MDLNQESVMKYFFAAVIMLTFVFTFGIFQVHAEVCGGYTKAETDDSEVAAAANFADAGFPPKSPHAQRRMAGRSLFPPREG